jgi:hypothetical protein
MVSKVRMQMLRVQIETIARELAALCSDISVREDERGPFILAFGLKDVHSLELRRLGYRFEVELWHGSGAEEEYVEDKPQFDTAADAIERAKQWLSRDAV